MVITGASSGIGRALAKELASKGTRLALGARRTELLEELHKELSATEILIQKADVSNEDDCRLLIAENHQTFWSY